MALCVFWCRRCCIYAFDSAWWLIIVIVSHPTAVVNWNFLGEWLSLWQVSRLILCKHTFQFNPVNLGAELNWPEPLDLQRFIYHWIMQLDRGRQLNRGQDASCSFICPCHIKKVDRVELIHLLIIYYLAIRYSFTISWAHSLTNFIRSPSTASFLITFHAVLVMYKIVEKDGLKRHERISWEAQVSLNRTRSNKVQSVSLQRPTEKCSKLPLSHEALFCPV